MNSAHPPAAGIEPHQAMTDMTESQELEFCDMLQLDHETFIEALGGGIRARIGLMTLYDFYRTKLKVFKDTPRYFSRLEWGIKYHFLGTARAALNLGQRLDLTDLELHELTTAAFFHDIAKIKYDNDFFIRKLSRPDQRILNHSIESFQLVITYCGYFNYPIVNAILQHHEYYDGNGYPLGLKGDQIHLYARIIAIVDSYCAMMETREFSSKKETVKDVLEEIETCRHSQFDPDIADIFIRSQPGTIGKGCA